MMRRCPGPWSAGPPHFRITNRAAPSITPDPGRHRLRSARPVAKLTSGRRDWYRIDMHADTDVADVWIYDEIGYFAVTAQDFARELAGITATAITLHLSSPGGEVFDGLAIYNALRNHPATITTRIEGLAASIASVIAQAGDTIIIERQAQMMIHDGSGLCVGNAADMRELADLLDRCSDSIAGVYAERAGGTPASWRKAMKAETWYSAEEAVAAGLADEVVKLPAKSGTGAPASNDWDLSIFAYDGREHAPTPEVVPDVPEVVAPAPPVFDPEAFRQSMSDALERPFSWDADAFRDSVAASAGNAPSVTSLPRPAPVEVEEPEVGEPEAAPAPWSAWHDAEYARQVLAQTAAVAPAPTVTDRTEHDDTDNGGAQIDGTVISRTLRGLRGMRGTT